MTSTPVLVAHADWSKNVEKRWLAVAQQQVDGCFYAEVPEPVQDAGRLLGNLRTRSGPQAAILAGFDFPIGIPQAYAQAAGVASFLDFLPWLGHGDWLDFYHPAFYKEQISLQRPFYPDKPGSTSQHDLIQRLQQAGLEITTLHDLHRRCEMAHEGRRAAAPLFWTMGAQQVGKAALAGWKELVQPALHRGDIAIWPFSGPLLALLQPGSTTVVETYPAEFMAQFIQATSITPPARLSKRSSCSRMEAGRLLFEQAQQHGIVLSNDLSNKIRSGFGPKPDGEDAFDAAIGLLGMLAVLQNWYARPDPAAGMPAWLSVEGWIFGQPWQICPDQNPV